MRKALFLLTGITIAGCLALPAAAGSNMTSVCMASDEMRDAYLAGDTDAGKAKAVELMADGRACSNAPLPPTPNVALIGKKMIFYADGTKRVAAVLPIAWVGHPETVYIVLWDPDFPLKSIALAKE